MSDFRPQLQEDGSVLISDQQAKLHASTELLSVAVTAPFFVWLATRRRPLVPVERAGLWVLTAGILAVDGYLAYRFLRLRVGARSP